jgi:hypothetical protein
MFAILNTPCLATAMTWAKIHEKIISTLSAPIPPEFRVAKGNSNRATGTRKPANFDLHLPTDLQLRTVKWAPRLVEYGMEKLKTFYTMETPARDPGHNFWRTASSIRAMFGITSKPVVTGEAQIQSSGDHLLDPICSIASRIIFHLTSDGPTLEQGDKHSDLYAQTSDNGPPLWDTVIKLSEDENSKEISVLIERIIYAVEYKSLTAAPSTFFFHLGCYAAVNTMLGPRSKTFDYQTCRLGTDCLHFRNRSFRRSVDVPMFFDKLDEAPSFDPSEEEAQNLLADIRLLNDDSADNSGVISQNTSTELLAKHPRIHVALAINRTGAVSLSEDTHDDPVAAKQARTPRRSSARLQSSPSRVEGAEEIPDIDCQDYSFEGSSNEHSVFILQQVKSKNFQIGYR